MKPKIAPSTRTLADAARQLGVSHSRLNYFALKLRVDPIQVVGSSRLFSEADVQRLVREIAAVDAARGQVPGQVPMVLE